MLPVSGIPKCVAFRSEHNGSYLRYVHDSDKPLFDLSGKDCISPYTRFYLEASKEHQGLVHIRCCYNNTYWVVQQQLVVEKEEATGGGSWIIGTADEPEEDLSKPSCTLFKINPATQDDPHSVRLLYAHLGNHACVISTSDKANYLHARHGGTREDNIFSAYTLLDLSGKLLPKCVAFKGDNDKYLSAQYNSYNFLKYSSHDIGDPTVANTVITNGDGTIRVKSNHFGKFWRRSPNWIWADSSDTTNRNPDTLFRAINVGEHFALRNLGNNYFCVRLTTDGKIDCLNAASQTITQDAKIMVEEAVISREIYNVDFNLSKARIYGEKVITMCTASSVNLTTEPQKVRLKLVYKETDMSTWDSTVSWKLSVTANIRAGIPVIAEAKVDVKNEFSGKYHWGSTIEKTTEQSIEYEVTVPPMTKVTVSLIASQGSCDVPFSYKQQDLLYDGREVTYDMDDGIYTGVNCYDFKYVTKEEKIDVE